MSIIGDTIHRIRDFKGMAQKQLSVAVGFDEKSVDVRTDLLFEWQRRKKTLLTVRSARPNIHNGTGRKRPMTAVSTNPRKSGVTIKTQSKWNSNGQMLCSVQMMESLLRFHPII